ncbi:MAG: VirE protein, partial [Bacteroidales bacterium]
MNYLDQPISIYKNVRGIVGRTCTLRSFLLSTKYKERILEIRAIEDKKARDILKIQLPQATI